MPDRLPPKLRALVDRTRPLHGPSALVLGFLWDALTLHRVDRLQDNLLLLTYLLLLGALLVVERRIAHGRPMPAFLQRRHRWLAWATGFLFGGLYSAYVIFYAKSTGFGWQLLFLALLVALLVLNELLSRWLRVELLSLALYTFCAFSFLLFFLPVITGSIGAWVPGVAAAVALAMTALVALLVHGVALGEETPPRPLLALHATTSLGAVGWLLALLWLNLVPPVPLALEKGGIYHHVERAGDGYLLRWERTWRRPFARHDRVFVRREGDAVHCFTAVFAPTGLTLDVVHVWEQWDGGWVVRDRIPYAMKGGRDGGFRGWTRKRNVSPGDWRVRVETPDGREIGRVRFEIVDGEGEPRLVEAVY